MKDDQLLKWNKKADSWDSVINSERHPHYHYYRTTDFLVSRLIQEKNAKKILEVGCGTAQCAINVIKQVKGGNDIHITGVDASPRMIELGNKKIAEVRLENQISLQTGNVTNLNFPDESFDLVFSRGTLISYVDNPKIMIKEIARVLKTGGYIGFDVMNRPDNMRPYFLWKLDGYESDEWIKNVPDKPLYLMEFSVDEDYQTYREYSIEPSTDLYSEIVKKFEQLPNILPGIIEAPKSLNEAKIIDSSKNKLFRPSEIKNLLEDCGFNDIKTLGEGIFLPLLRNDELRPFINKYRDYFCKIEIMLQDSLDINKAVMLFTSGKKRLCK